MRLARVDLPFGLAWQPADGCTPCPVVYGDVRRDDAEVVGLLIGVTARSMSRRSNTHEVTVPSDAVTVQREVSEPIYDGPRPSLFLRVATQLGTSRAWALIYD